VRRSRARTVSPPDIDSEKPEKRRQPNDLGERRPFVARRSLFGDIFSVQKGKLMKYVACFLGAAILCASSFQRPAPAQSPAPPPAGPSSARTDQDEEDVIRIGTREVFLPVSVRDEYDRPFPGLDARDFIVVEDGVRQEVTSLRRLPLRMVVALDASSSFMSLLDGKTEDAYRAALLALIEGFGAEDRMCVLMFGEGVRMLQDWTSDKESLRRAVTVGYRADQAFGGQTHFWDALVRAKTQLTKVQGRRTILMFTDAYGIGGKFTPEDAQNALLQVNAGLYVVTRSRVVERAPIPKFLGSEKSAGVPGGVGGEAIPPGGRKNAVALMYEQAEFLRKLTERTGGRFFETDDLPPPPPNFMTSVSPKPPQIALAPRRIFEELGGQYVLTYVSSHESDAPAYRKIAVFLGRPGLRAGVREGYFTQPDRRR
jgi:VWFA-related protein